jgi:transposase-like protein
LARYDAWRDVLELYGATKVPHRNRDALARSDLAAWLAKWSGKYPKLTGWVEENIDETLTFYRLPRQHHKHLKSSNRPICWSD